MLNIPDRYKIGVNLALKDFIPKDLKPDHKKRIKESIKRVQLIAQIVGEEIPSVINEEYRCEVIQFYDIEIYSMKDASFLVGLYQSLIKSLCVIRIHDSAKEAYSFCGKRLNQQDATQIIIEDSIMTELYHVGLPDMKREQMLSYIEYAKVSNKADKLCFYKEIFVKVFLLSNAKAYTNVAKILDSDLWYDSNKSERVFYCYKRLVDHRALLTKATTNAEKVTMNQQIKNDIQLLNEEKY